MDKEIMSILYNKVVNTANPFYRSENEAQRGYIIAKVTHQISNYAYPPMGPYLLLKKAL